MKREWLLIIGSVSLTLLTAILLVRWFAPQLIGLPVDLQMVRVAKETPPFFDGVFRTEDYESKDFIIQDPFIMRAQPLLPRFLRIGPHDILGFRNRNVPNIADIITIGDSQTYGNNVTLEENWPNSMLYAMEDSSPVIYNMSVGGWGATEYFEIFNKALYLQPKIVIVAFYTGNDAIDTFKKVYADERWKSLRLNPKLTPSDIPSFSKNSEWKVKFTDGVETVFTPGIRYLSNKRDNPAVITGYKIIAEVAQKMGEIAQKVSLRLIFTIIPTKELAFKKKLLMENIPLREDFTALIEDEEKNFEGLAKKLKAIPNSEYVDLLIPLQSAVYESQDLYSPEKEGHPIENGYKLIGTTLQKEVIKLLPEKLQGGAIAQISITDDNYWPLLINNGYFYRFESQTIAEKNGWNNNNIKVVDLREINKLRYGGLINNVNPALYGPQAFTK